MSKTTPPKPDKTVAAYQRATNTKTRQRLAAQMLGVEAEGVGVYKLQISFLRDFGILVDIDASRVGVFNKPASFAELGFEDDDPRRDHITRGTTSLVAKSKVTRTFASIVERARQVLRRRAYPLKGFAPYYWLPFTAWSSFEEEWGKLSQRADEVKAKLVAEYATLRAEVRPAFKSIAQRSWQQMHRRRAERGKRNGDLHVDGETFANYAAFEAYVVNAALAAFPTVDDIRDGMTLVYRTSIIASESDVQAELAKVDQARAVSAKANAKRREAELKLAEQQLELTTRERKAQVEISEAERLAQIKLRAEAAKAQAEVEAMRAARLEAYRNQMLADDSPVMQVIETMRERLLGAVREVHTRFVANDSRLLGKSAERLSSLLAEYKMLNAGIEDSRLEAMLQDLERAIKPGQAAGRSSGQVAAALTALVDDLAKPVEEIARKDGGRFRFINPLADQEV